MNWLPRYYCASRWIYNEAIIFVRASFFKQDPILYEIYSGNYYNTDDRLGPDEMYYRVFKHGILGTKNVYCKTIEDVFKQLTRCRNLEVPHEWMFSDDILLRTFAGTHYKK